MNLAARKMSSQLLNQLLASIEGQSNTDHSHLYQLLLSQEAKVLNVFKEKVDQLVASFLVSDVATIAPLCQSLQDNIEAVTNLFHLLKQCVQSNTSHLPSFCLMLALVFKVVSSVLHLCKEIESNHESVFEKLGNAVGVVFRSIVSLLKNACENVELLRISSLIEKGHSSLISNVISTLISVAQGSLHFDPSLVLVTWKSLGKFICHLKDHIESLRSDEVWSIQGMVQGICDAMLRKSRECINCAPAAQYKASDGCSSSFSKLLKTCRFFTTLVVKITQEYENYHHLFCETVFLFLLELISYLPPSPVSIRTQLSHPILLELEANISLVSEPLMLCLMNCEPFLNLLTTPTEAMSRFSYSWCWLLCCLLRFYYQLQENSKAFLLEPSTARENSLNNSCRILNAVFSCASTCYCELSLPVTLPGVIPAGQPVTEVSLYEYLTVHLCGLIAILPATHFHILERILIHHLCSSELYCSLLAADAWSFLARWGSSELCWDHVQLLTELMNTCHTFSLASLNICCVFRRLFSFLSSHQQRQFIQEHVPSLSNIRLWTNISIESLDDSLISEVTSLLERNCCNILQDNCSSSLVIVHCLQCLNELLSSTKCKPHLSPHPQPLIDILLKLLPGCVQHVSSSQSIEICHVMVTYQLLKVIAAMIHSMTVEQAIQILTAVYWLSVNVAAAQWPVVVGVATLLSRCGILTSPLLKDPLCACFNLLLGDTQLPWLPRHCVLEAFKGFAEVTPFSDMLEKCIPSIASNSVVQFLQKIPHGAGETKLLETSNIIRLLKAQHQANIDSREDSNSEEYSSETKLQRSDNMLDILSNLQQSWQQLQHEISLSNHHHSAIGTVTNELTRVWTEMGQFIDTLHHQPSPSLVQ